MFGSREMTQWVKVFAGKFDDLSSNTEEEEN